MKEYKVTIEDMEEIIDCIIDCDMNHVEAIAYAEETLIEISEDK